MPTERERAQKAFARVFAEARGAWVRRTAIRVTGMLEHRRVLETWTRNQALERQRAVVEALVRQKVVASGGAPPDRPPDADARPGAGVRTAPGAGLAGAARHRPRREPSVHGVGAAGPRGLHARDGDRRGAPAPAAVHRRAARPGTPHPPGTPDDARRLRRRRDRAGDARRSPPGPLAPLRARARPALPRARGQ